MRGALLKLLKARRHPEDTNALVTLASDTWTPDIRWDGHRIRFPIAEGAAEVLGSPPPLDDVHGERSLAIAMKLETEGITGALLRALVANGTAKGRAAVVTAALQDDSFVIRLSFVVSPRTRSSPTRINSRAVRWNRCATSTSRRGRPGRRSR
ncbi:MAG TPA: hypothetical protein VGE08_21125 [Steroidobacter sp.]|uniref:hypothetical protein n=1 Tax=Steroidobacter sp. TaxID=1978227 RepID=UPI002EDA6EAC